MDGSGKELALTPRSRPSPRCTVQATRNDVALRPSPTMLYRLRRPSQPMIIHVKKMCLPLSRALEVESTDTVGSVKEKLGNIVGEGPPQLMLLILANKLLDNDRTLASYNIQDGSSIYLKHNLFSKKDPTEIFRV
ncbi:hypothetical protein QYE76_000728 [Lolium multiflorum]|uniref:Ubiquitin-like domain-containing protein n=1 Tax=Lolium multiflorum TaxID=4521 RepID=A0AAD8RIB7_LOLMU|nr:hypothetical protein QYE76_000728 [Lolium multiflorum]